VEGGESLHCVVFHSLGCVALLIPLATARKYPALLERRESNDPEHGHGVCIGGLHLSSNDYTLWALDTSSHPQEPCVGEITVWTSDRSE